MFLLSEPPLLVPEENKRSPRVNRIGNNSKSSDIIEKNRERERKKGKNETGSTDRREDNEDKDNLAAEEKAAADAQSEVSID